MCSRQRNIRLGFVCQYLLSLLFVAGCSTTSQIPDDEQLYIGIKDINKPDFGDSVEIREGELPVFWACGVTPQAVIMAAKPDFAITHAPGHMFIADLRDNDYAVF